MNRKIIIAVLLLFAALSGCTRGSYVVRNSREDNRPGRMSMQYGQFDGFKETSITAKEGEIVTIAVQIVTKSGSLEVSITKDQDEKNVPYQGKELPTSSFTVTLTEPGKYRLRAEGNKHSGSYLFTWETKEAGDTEESK